MHTEKHINQPPQTTLTKGSTPAIHYLYRKIKLQRLREHEWPNAKHHVHECIAQWNISLIRIQKLIKLEYNDHKMEYHPTLKCKGKVLAFNRTEANPRLYKLKVKRQEFR